MKRFFGLNLVGIGLLWSFTAMAVDLSPTLSLHGYVSAIGAKSEGNPWTTRRTLDRWDWAQHEAGLTFNWSATDSTRLTASVVSRNRGEIDNGEPQLQILSLNHIMQSESGQVWGVRLGRIKNTLMGLYSGQSVPSERDGVIPAISYQGPIPEAFEAMDGLSVYGEWNSKTGDQFEWQLYGGVRHDLRLKHHNYYMFGGEAPGEITSITLMGAKVLWVPARYPNLVFSASLVELDEGFGHGQSVSAAAQKALAGACVTRVAPCITDYASNVRAWVLSGRGIWGRWSVTGEMAVADISVRTQVVANVRRFDELAYTGYLQLGYTPAAGVQLWLRGESTGYSRNPKVPGNPYIHYAQTVTLAGRYYLSPRWFVTAQLSHNDGTATLAGFEGLFDRPVKRRWALYLISLTYQF